MEGTGETDWPAEEERFELPVPPQEGLPFRGFLLFTSETIHSDERKLLAAAMPPLPPSP
jgi:hypothetical protein